MRDIPLIVVLTLLLTGGVIHSQDPTGSIIVAEGFAAQNTPGRS